MTDSEKEKKLRKNFVKKWMIIQKASEKSYQVEHEFSHQ